MSNAPERAKDSYVFLLTALEFVLHMKSKISSNNLRKKHRMEFYINDLLDSFTS